MKNLKDFWKQVENDPMRFEIFSELNKVGGWRGLFDSLAHEWLTANITDKWVVITRLMKLFKCDFGDLVWAYAEDCNTLNNLYKLDGLPGSIIEYSNYYIEAKEFFEKDHPELARFGRSLMLHWKYYEQQIVS